MVDTTSIIYIPMIGLWVTPNGRGMLYMFNYNTKYHLLPNPICHMTWIINQILSTRKEYIILIHTFH